MFSVPNYLSVIAACLLFSASAYASESTTLLTAKRILTLDPAQPEATAMVWDGQGKILAVGDANLLRKQFPNARHIKADNQHVLPGLIDAHVHIMMLGFSLLDTNLIGASSAQEVVSRLKQHATDIPKGAWIRGFGWDQTRWSPNQFPTADVLDAAFPDHPVWLERIDGHTGWANSAAMKMAKLPTDHDSLDGEWQPQGGHIQRDKSHANGIFIDSAMTLIKDAIPLPDENSQRKALASALQLAVSHGITGLHDMWTTREQLALMTQFADEEKLPLRITAYADGNGNALSDLCHKGAYRHAGQRLQMRGVKFFVDGALGSRGAALLQPYTDDTHTKGILITTPVQFENDVRHALDCNVQVATHAIGDHANRLVLDTYEKVGGTQLPQLRWRIEHAQILSASDMHRFADSGVIASMQPTHATSDMGWAEQRLGHERIKGAYAWNSLLKQHTNLVFGSDAPIESINPWLGLYAAVTRQNIKGEPKQGWHPAERITLAEALRAFTANAASASFSEHITGRLVEGVHADFIIINQDFHSLENNPAGLLKVKIESTWVDGKKVYSAE